MILKIHSSYPDSKDPQFECLPASTLECSFELCSVSRICFQMLDETLPCPCLSILRVTGIAQLLRWVFLRAQRCLRCRIHGAWFCHHQVHGFRLRHGRALFRSTILSSLRHDVLLSVWKKWLRENINGFIMFKKRRRWFHSSRVKLPLVKMYRSWFLVSTYLIWLFGSKFLLSNNQSTATLWVHDTCLTVGLLPSINILITASLSSNMHNWDLPWDECSFAGTLSTFNISVSLVLYISRVLRLTSLSRICFHMLDEYCSWNTVLLSQHPIDRVQVIHPFAIQHPTK